MEILTNLYSLTPSGCCIIERMNYNLIIRGGEVIDGSGAPPFRGDIGVKDGRIEAVGDLSGEKAGKVIEGVGGYVTPGFIDIHSHSDFSVLIGPRAESKVRQGVTTEVIGNCGSSAAPLSGQKLERVRKQNPDLRVDWARLSEYRMRVEERGVALNLVPLTGQGNIRATVMGYREGEPTPAERKEMLSLLEQSLGEGSWGLSTGLIYPPGIYSGFDELVELISLTAESGGIYATHLRDESGGVVEAVEEAILLAGESGASLQISHLKAQGRSNWGLLDSCLERIESARAGGLLVHCDRYPYTAGSTGLDILLPAWTYAGGEEEELKRLSDPALREKIKGDINCDEWDAVKVSRVMSPGNKKYEGWSLAEIAADRKEKPGDSLLNLLSEERLRVEALFFSMSPGNLEKILRKDYCLVGSDSSARAVSGPLSRGKPHPRAYGTFPGFLRSYAADGLLSWEEAVHKITGLPARKLGLEGRGLVRAGAAADLVLLNPERLKDRATYQDPHRYPEGLDYVIVNGEIVVEGGEQTEKLPGKVLRRR